MMNALFNKVFFRLRIVYDNFLKSSKTLKEIKTYFIYVNNRHKMTREIHEKEKIQKIDKTVRFHILKRFVSFFSRSTYTSQFFIFFRRIIDYRKQKNVDENACFNCHEQSHVVINCSKSKKQIIQMNNFNSIFDDDLDSVHIINELNSNHVNSNIDFDFKRKKLNFSAKVTIKKKIVILCRIIIDDLINIDSKLFSLKFFVKLEHLIFFD